MRGHKMQMKRFLTLDQRIISKVQKCSDAYWHRWQPEKILSYLLAVKIYNFTQYIYYIYRPLIFILIAENFKEIF